MLPLFPQRALDSSVHTAILIGIIFSWLATETLGWAFAGFVVAGYLAAIALVKPTACAAILLESILTYALVWAVGKGAQALRVHHRIFGRERFLLFILFSVPVRIIVEVYAEAGLTALAHDWGLPAPFSTGPYRSVGLVIVPLTANTFWKVGLARGLWQSGLTASLTYSSIRFVLLPLTNYQIGTLDLAFEEVALHFAAVPKLYMVLLIAAMVAAHNNLRFGWDFNGILVPSLLALLALQPLKALTTVIEAWVLVWSFRLLIQLPGIRGLNLQGPRRLCSMYLLSFALKLLLSWAAQWWWPQLFVSDLFGFGYLLTSLIAVKCVQRGDSARVLIPSVLTAAQGALLGRGLALLLALWLGLDSDTRDHSSPRIRTGPAMARSLLLAATRVRRTPPDAPPAEGQHIVRVLHRWLQDKAQPAETLLSGMPHAIVRQWVQRRDARRCLHLFVPRHGLAPAPGVPSVWLCARRGPVWLVPPDPLAAEVPGWVSAWLADRLPVAAVVMLGAPLPERQGRLGKAPWRAHETLASLRTALSGRPTWILQARPGADSRLVPLSSPALTDVAALRALLPGLQVRFGEVPGALQPVLHADSAWLTFAPTRLAATLPPAPKHNQPTRARLQHIEAQAWRRDDPRPYPLGNSESRLASAAMIQAAASAADRRSASKPLPAAVAFAAQQLGWRAHTHRLDPGQTLWWLDGGVSGQVLLAPGRAGGWQVLAPRAVDEAGTAAIALHAFTTLRARALFIAGSAVPGPALGFGDSLRPVAAHAPLGPLIVRALLRDSPAHAHHPVRTLIVRAQPPERRPVHGIVLTVGEEIPPQLGPELRRALTPALRPWAPPALMQGQAAFAGLATTHHLPDRYLAHTDRSRAVVAWFADALLTEVDGHPEKASVLELLRASHIPVTAPEDPEPKDPGPGAGPAMRPAKGRAARRRRATASDEDALTALRHFLQTGAWTPLTRARQASRDLRVYDSGLRLQWMLHQDGKRCLLQRPSGDLHQAEPSIQCSKAP